MTSGFTCRCLPTGWVWYNGLCIIVLWGDYVADWKMWFLNLQFTCTTGLSCFVYYIRSITQYSLLMMSFKGAARSMIMIAWPTVPSRDNVYFEHVQTQRRLNTNAFAFKQPSCKHIWTRNALLCMLALTHLDYWLHLSLNTIATVFGFAFERVCNCVRSRLTLRANVFGFDFVCERDRSAFEAYIVSGWYCN